MKRFAVGYEYFCRIVLMIFVAHIAFIVHTVLGAVVLGLFPSISATYSTYRTWVLDKDKDRSWTVRRTWIVFHRSWVDDFSAANIFGWIQLIVGALLAWDYYLVNFNNMGRLGFAASGILLAVNVLYILFVIISWAVRSNYDESMTWVARMSVHMIIARPLCTLLLIVMIIITGYLWYHWMGLLAAFGLSLPVFLIMVTIYSFGRLPGMNAQAEKESQKR